MSLQQQLCRLVKGSRSSCLPLGKVRTTCLIKLSFFPRVSYLALFLFSFPGDLDKVSETTNGKRLKQSQI